MAKVNQIIAEQKVKEQCEKLNFTLVDNFTYIGANKTELHIKCNGCGKVHNPMYHNFISPKTKCCKCFSTITQVQAEENVANACAKKSATLNSPFKYEGQKHTRLDLTCNICGKPYKTKPSYQSFVTTERGCYNCGHNKTNEKLNLDTDYVVKSITDKCKMHNFTLLTENIDYKNNTSIFHVKCNVCGTNIKTNYVKFVTNNDGCRVCADKNRLRESNGSYK